MTAEILMMPQTEKENIVSQAVKNYGGKLMSFIRPKVKNTQDAEDILQDVWYQFSNLTNLSEINNIGSWLYRVSNNRIIDRYRKKKTENLEDFGFEDEDGDFSFREILLMDNSGNPELQLFQDEIWTKIFVALDELPFNQRLVFTENMLEDKTLQQIANEQGENLKNHYQQKTIRA